MRRFVMLLCFYALPVVAQDATLMQRLDKAERDLFALRQQVYQGNPPSDTSQSLNGDSFNIIDSRLSTLEEQLRTMTGTQENLEYRLNLNEKHTLELEKALEVEKQLRIEKEKLAALPKQPAAAQSPATVASTKTPDTAFNKSTTLTVNKAHDDYGKAYQFLKEEKYADAEKGFAAFLKEYPNDPLASNAQYWYGESFYVRKNYTKSGEAFLTGYEKFPKTSKGPDFLLKLGLSLSHLKSTEEACQAFARMKIEYPFAEKSILSRAESEQKSLGCTTKRK
jgi:tol-pal system protein YbgF